MVITNNKAAYQQGLNALTHNIKNFLSLDSHPPNMYLNNIYAQMQQQWNIKKDESTSEPQSSNNDNHEQNSKLIDELLFSRVLDTFSNESNSNQRELGAIGTGQRTPSVSPHTESSENSMGMSCGRCNKPATHRCLECLESVSSDCVAWHQAASPETAHCIVRLNNLSPIGTGSNALTESPKALERHCDVHFEVLRYVCINCVRIVCQECTLWEHKEHHYVSFEEYSETAPVKLETLIQNSNLGKQFIKDSIDLAVLYSQTIERDAAEISQKIRKIMRQFVMAVEDREKSLLEQVNSCKINTITALSDQMAGLRAALAGLAETAELTTKTYDSIKTISTIDLSLALAKAENQIHQFAMMYRTLQPKERFYSFTPPNMDFLKDERFMGSVSIVDKKPDHNSFALQAYLSNQNSSSKNMDHHNNPQSYKSSLYRSNQLAIATHANGSNIGGTNHNNNNVLVNRRPIVRHSALPPPPGIPWDNTPNRENEEHVSNVGQAIPGSHNHIAVKSNQTPTLSFAYDGHEDGQVSRPWGLCVDKNSHIIVADRRNNRVQIFYENGTLKHKFGRKGSADGEFDLPAGISTDPWNRIVVVDKDNHRVQVFGHYGNFILKFGTFGKECGQFQYPWDVAVNSRGEILVSDSRNHRLQLFNNTGHFLARFSFEGCTQFRGLKCVTTPRGICFTPNGNIIVSDFENHRLILVDSELSKILAIKGHEGSGVHEFNRPSGICCDDDGRIVIADSKNQRVLVYSRQLVFMWSIDIRPCIDPRSVLSHLDEKDRPSDVAVMPNGKLVVMLETSPDARDTSNPHKPFIQIY